MCVGETRRPHTLAELRAAPLSKAWGQARAAHLWPPERCFLSTTMGTLWGIWGPSAQQKLSDPGYRAAMETEDAPRAGDQLALLTSPVQRAGQGHKLGLLPRTPP